jgi:hypothetical protein
MLNDHLREVGAMAEVATWRRMPIPLLLLGLALAARVVLLFALGASAPPVDDERGYAAVAGSLARGEGFGFTVEGTGLDGEPVMRRLLAFRAPLYPVLLAPMHLATDGSPLALRLWSCLLGALAAPLAFSLARRAHASTVVATLAGVAVALWPSHAWLSTRLLSEPLDSVLLLAAAEFALRRRPFHCGAALGLALLCRPGGLAAALFLGLVVTLGMAPGKRLRAAALFVASVALVVTPWLVRNAIVLGSAVSVTSAGVTLLGGNCAAALDADPPGKWVAPARAWNGPGRPDLGMYGWSTLDEVASDARFAEAARTWAEDHPRDAALLVFWKVVRFFDPDTRSTKEDAGRKALLGWISWGPALLLLAVALVSRPWRLTPPWWVAVALLAGHLLGAMITYGDARMRSPVEPVLLALLIVPVAGGWLERRRATSREGTRDVDPSREPSATLRP